MKLAGATRELMVTDQSNAYFTQPRRNFSSTVHPLVPGTLCSDLHGQFKREILSTKVMYKVAQQVTRWLITVKYTLSPEANMKATLRCTSWHPITDRIHIRVHQLSLKRTLSENQEHSRRSFSRQQHLKLTGNKEWWTRVTTLVYSLNLGVSVGCPGLPDCFSAAA